MGLLTVNLPGGPGFCSSLGDSGDWGDEGCCGIFSG